MIVREIEISKSIIDFQSPLLLPKPKTNHSNKKP